MAKDINLAAILKQGPLKAWDAAQLMMRHLIDEYAKEGMDFDAAVRAAGLTPDII